MKEVKISNLQLGLMTMGYLYGTTAITDPVIMAKRDAWIVSLLGYIVGTALLILYFYISKLNPDKTLTEILEYCFGKFIGKLVSLLFVWFFIYKAAMNLRGFGIFLSITSYPDTPVMILIGIFAFTVYFVVKNDLNSIGKISELTIPIIPIPILIMTSSLITVKYFINFKPILLDIVPVLKSSFNFMSVPFGDYVVFLMIFPYTVREKGRLKAIFIGDLVFCILHFISIIRNLILIGPSIIEYIIFPNHISAQLIPNISIVPLVDLNLILGGGLKISLLLYGAVKATAEVFNIKDHTPLTSAFTVFMVVFSAWLYRNAIEWYAGLHTLIGSSVISFPFFIIIPVLLMIITLIKNKMRASGKQG